MSLKLELPSNKKFGYLFSAIFFVSSFYFFYFYNKISGYLFLSLSLIFIIISIVKPILLLPLNKLWMQIGLFLGKIVSPIILGIIFYCLITPYSIVLKFMGRDELKLKIKKKNSYWLKRNDSLNKIDFDKQF
jgi:hypothetical protein